MPLTEDRHDGCLHEVDPVTGLQQCYLILPSGLRQNLVRPLRLSYVHEKCGAVTTMALKIAETYAANPKFYGGTYCAKCHAHYPVGEDGEFRWERDGTKVGT